MLSDSSRLAQRWWEEVWERGELDVLDEILSDPFTRHSSRGTIVEPVDAYKRLLRSAQRTFHRPVTDVHALDIVGDRMWTRATSRGMNLDSGARHVVSWLLLQRVVSGRIAEMWVLTGHDVDWTVAD